MDGSGLSGGAAERLSQRQHPPGAAQPEQLELEPTPVFAEFEFQSAIQQLIAAVFQFQPTTLEFEPTTRQSFRKQRGANRRRG